jgi:hypothetical protein
MDDNQRKQRHQDRNMNTNSRRDLDNKGRGEQNRQKQNAGTQSGSQPGLGKVGNTSPANSDSGNIGSRGKR